MDQPILTPRLRLRPFRPDDLDALHALWSDPVVGPWVGGTHAELRESAEELEGHLRHQERHGFSVWAVEERETGLLVGEIGLQYFEGHGPEVEIGWAVSADGRGKGYTIEASERWLDIAFDELGLDRVIAVVLPDNLVSRRVCERLGMTEEGMRHAYGRKHVVYAIGREPAA
jgi:RimJ/RimL family protein N-acetyltransferase